MNPRLRQALTELGAVIVVVAIAAGVAYVVTKLVTGQWL